MSSRDQKKSASVLLPSMGKSLMPRLAYWLISPILLYGLFLLIYAEFFEERLPIGPEVFIPVLVLVPISIFLALNGPE
jgi:hypothetical protein